MKTFTKSDLIAVLNKVQLQQEKDTREFGGEIPADIKKAISNFKARVIHEMDQAKTN